MKRSLSLIPVILIALIAVLPSCRSHKKPRMKASSEQTVRIKSKVKGERQQIVEEALAWEGTPYRYGASEKGKGTDCSGMVLKVYEKATGKKLPRNSRAQADFCTTIKEKDVLPGDLAFFATGKDKHRISHVGIMLDKTRFIHASTKKGVVISEITTPYYQRTFIQYSKVP